MTKLFEPRPTLFCTSCFVLDTPLQHDGAHQPHLSPAFASLIGFLLRKPDIVSRISTPVLTCQVSTSMSQMFPSVSLRSIQ